MPWLRLAIAREIEVGVGETPGVTPASRLREIFAEFRRLVVDCLDTGCGREGDDHLIQGCAIGGDFDGPTILMNDGGRIQSRDRRTFRDTEWPAKLDNRDPLLFAGEFVRKPAAFDEQESPSQLLQFVELMAGDEHGDAVVGSPLSEHGDELEHAIRVETHERFVENQELRIIDQRDDQRKTHVSCRTRNRQACGRDTAKAPQVQAPGGLGGASGGSDDYSVSRIRS